VIELLNGVSTRRKQFIKVTLANYFLMAPKYVDQPERMESLKARIEKLGKGIEGTCAEMDESNEMKEDVSQLLTKLDRMVKSHIAFQVSLWRLN
jgi:hypothetical protein